METKAMKLGFLFPGGGTQYLGMGKSICDLDGSAMDTFEEASDILKTDLIDLCLNGSFEHLSDMRNAQPLTYTVGVAAYRAFKKVFGISATIGAGHSLGEYTALTAANALAFDKGIQLVSQRGKLLQEVGDLRKSTMMSVAEIIEDDIVKIVKQYYNVTGDVFIGVYNSPTNFVLSGTIEALENIRPILEKYGAETRMLFINTASHSPFMKDSIDHFKESLDDVIFSKPEFDVVSNVTGVPYTNMSKPADILLQHLVMPVQWTKTMQYIADQHMQVLVDSGPKSILKSIAAINHHDYKSYGLDVEDDLKELCVQVGITFPDTETILKKMLVTCVSTPNSSVDDAVYISEVPGKYKELEMLYRSGDWFPAYKTIAKAKGLAKDILLAKGASKLEVAEVMC
jgi:[acyl-carrier-protein] S-malonyltransferase